MCGRTACTLQPTDITRACCYQGKHGMLNIPEWRDPLNGRKYYPSQNIAPSLHTYYEWQTNGKIKQPYYIYLPQPNGAIMDDNLEKDFINHWDEVTGWTGPKLLTMAGIFEKWKPPNATEECETIYSYSILTMDASPKVSEIHERMPAILENDETIQKWLDFENVSLDEAMKLLVPVNDLAFHPVSSYVSNSRNKGPECMKPIQKGDKKVLKNTGLTKWLISGKTVSNSSKQKQTYKEDNKLFTVKEDTPNFTPTLSQFSSNKKRSCQSSLPKRKKGKI